MSEERPVTSARPVMDDRPVTSARPVMDDRPVISARPAIEELPVKPERSAGGEQAEPSGNGAKRSADLATLREILVGPEQRRLTELADRLDAMGLTPADLAEHLPEAIALSASRDRRLGRALAPTVEAALRESIRRSPRDIATAIFPVLGPAIRKAIAETMAALVRSINHAVEHSLSPQGIKWRVESWRTGVPYAEIVIKHALVYRVEQVFLIHAETGLLLAHAAAADLKVPDADLISSMMSAIQDFVRDSFRPAEGATLRAFTVGEHTVHVEVGPRALLAAVIRGQAPESVALKLQRTLETIHLEFARRLGDFAGETAPFETVRPLLDECLETVLATEQRAERSRLVFFRWAIPVGVLALLGIGLAIRSRLQFGQALRALQAEPGIVVVDASRGWRGWRFRGLRDPMAREPSTVLAAVGLPSRAVAGQWEPYLSLDSAMVVERVKRSLGTPASVTASLHGDSLAFRGDAPIDWLARVHAAAAQPGVSSVDVSAVAPTLPPRLDSLRHIVEAERVLFDAGSSVLTEGAVRQVRALAPSLRRLVDGVAAVGASVRIELVGRTDPSGTDKTNQTLSQRRVDEVSSLLSSSGVAAGLLTGRGVATSRPLPVADPDQRARVNRSVSFEVTVWTGPQAPKGL